MNISILINSTCPVFIEETAHIIAAMMRDSADIQSTSISIKQPIQILNNQKNSTNEMYKGEIVLSDGNGFIKSDSEGIFRKMTIVYSGFGSHYIGITKYGLCYIRLDQEPSLRGGLYIYSTRNDINPTKRNAAFIIE